MKLKANLNETILIERKPRIKGVLLIVFALLIANPAQSTEPDNEELVNQLMQLCFQNPEFRATSSSLFKPENASEFELEFYKTAEKLRSKVSMLYLLEKRKKVNQDLEIICIDNILNTWPG